MLVKWEKYALQFAAFVGISAYPVASMAFHSRLIEFGKRTVDYPVPDEIIEIVEDELDRFKNLLMKVNADIAVTDSLNPVWRGGFYFRNGFELLLPVRAVAKNTAELPKMNQTVSISINDGFSSKMRSVDTTTEAGKRIFDGYILSEAARRFLIRRELHRANSRRFILTPVAVWILLSGIVCLAFMSLMRYSRLLSYGSLTVLVPMAFVTFRSTMWSVTSYGEMMLDHDTCADSPEYVEGARQYLKSSIATNLRIREALGDSRSEFIASNGDRIGDPWPYSKRLKAIDKFEAEEFQKKESR